jgi:peroxiredoxin Q/BCP
MTPAAKSTAARLSRRSGRSAAPRRGRQHHRSQRKESFRRDVRDRKSAEAIIAAEGLSQIQDSGEIERLCREVIEKNPDNVAKYRGGNEGVFKFFVGQVIRASRGQANPQLVNDSPCLTPAVKEVSLKDFQGRSVVIYFYPKANTPGCTVEACEFRDLRPKFIKQDVMVLGVSADPPKMLAGFIARQKLNFTLLSDPDHKMIEAYGAWRMKKFMGRSFHGHRTQLLRDCAGWQNRASVGPRQSEGPRQARYLRPKRW